MARPLRIEYPGAFYHVTSRGNRREAIYLDDGDRVQFLDCLCLTVERYGWRVHAYCLMNNHYHLLIETPDANLSRGMRQLNGVYTQKFNWLHGCVGHVFQGRYKAILVDKEAYLLELARYVVLNPVRAGLVPRAGDWPWSSYLATAGYLAPPPWLTVDWLRDVFSGDDRGAVYRRFVDAGVEDTQSPLADGLASALNGGWVLGGEDFAAEFAEPMRQAGAEVTKAERHLVRPRLADLRHAAGGNKAWMATAHRKHGYTMAAIAAEANLHYSSVSKIIKALEAANSQFKT